MTEQKNKKPSKLSLDQALNFFKIIERNRVILTKRYSGQNKTETEWKKEFKNRGVDF